MAEESWSAEKWLRSMSEERADLHDLDRIACFWAIAEIDRLRKMNEFSSFLMAGKQGKS